MTIYSVRLLGRPSMCAPDLENPSKVVSTYINRRRVALSHPRKPVVYTGGQAKYLDYANDYPSKS